MWLLIQFVNNIFHIFTFSKHLNVSDYCETVKVKASEEWRHRFWTHLTRMWTVGGFKRVTLEGGPVRFETLIRDRNIEKMTWNKNNDIVFFLNLPFISNTKAFQILAVRSNSIASVSKIQKGLLICLNIIPDAELLEWSLPGPFRGSVLVICVWFVLTHFNDESDLRSQMHRPSSKSQDSYWAGDATNKDGTNSHHHEVYCP